MSIVWSLFIFKKISINYIKFRNTNYSIVNIGTEYNL